MILMKKKELAEFLEVDARTITRWVNKGCPRKGHSYNLKEVLKWRGVIGGGEIGAENLENLSLQEQKLKYEIDLKKAQSELHDLKLKIEKEDYLPKEEVIKNLNDGFISFKRSCLNLENKIVMELGYLMTDDDMRRDVKSKIHNLVITALNNISKGNFDG